MSFIENIMVVKLCQTIHSQTNVSRCQVAVIITDGEDTLDGSVDTTIGLKQVAVGCPNADMATLRHIATGEGDANVLKADSELTSDDFVGALTSLARC